MHHIYYKITQLKYCMSAIKLIKKKLVLEIRLGLLEYYPNSCLNKH